MDDPISEHPFATPDFWKLSSFAKGTDEVQTLFPLQTLDGRANLIRLGDPIAS